MTKNAERLIELLAEVRETSYQDGRTMNDPHSTFAETGATHRACREANYAIITHLRSMTEEDLKSL